MVNNEQIATWEEFKSFVCSTLDTVKFQYKCEWLCAIKAGWDYVKFEQLYAEYVQSTQIKPIAGDNTTDIKGLPLERVARYFLVRGGVTTDIKEISEAGRWQVDGQGTLNRTALLLHWGQDFCYRIGTQLYMEAKNHSDPVTNEEFSAHFRRMVEHCCNIGIMISTAGYSIGRGLGIAQSIHNNSLQNRFHLLLTIRSLHEVAVERKAPWAVLTDALNNALNNSYVNDKDTQYLYSPSHCCDLARSEYERLF
jgi:hypothetical protein